jgi:murein DD-endopeptidase MepM/ murein hydrolase activator NlpD
MPFSPRPDPALAAALAGVLAVLVFVFAAPGSAAAEPALVASRTTSAAGDPPADPWTWPVGPPVVVVAPFRAPPTPYAAGHRGIDLTAEPGEPAVAPAAGVV